MRRWRSTRFWSVVAWTLFMLLVGAVLAIQAIVSLYDAQQACFFTRVPCPAGDDPVVGRLTFAFVGVPLLWLLGIGLAASAMAVQRRRHDRQR